MGSSRLFVPDSSRIFSKVLLCMVTFEIRSKAASCGAIWRKTFQREEAAHAKTWRGQELSVSEDKKEGKCGWNLLEARGLVSRLW